MKRAIRLTITASLLLAQSTSAQGVHVVDDDLGAAPYAEIQDAIDAAAPGDIVLVRAGDYPAIEVRKPLSIVAEDGALVSVPRVNARDISTGELVLHGLGVFPTLLGPSFELRNISVPVLVQDCELAGGIEQPAVGGGFGLEVDNCTDVAFVDCIARGGRNASGAPNVAAAVFDSVVHFLGTEISAQDGAPGFFFYPPERGGDGLLAIDSQVFCHGSTILAGAGGDAGSGCTGGEGGDGVVMNRSELRRLDSVIRRGAGGPAPAPCTPGALGRFFALNSSTVVTHPGVATTVSVEPVRREFELATFTVDGQPGDSVLLLLGIDLAPRLLPRFATPAFVSPAPPTFAFAAGVIPAGGILMLGIPVGDIPGAGLTAYAQVLTLGPSGVSVGSVRATTLLDASL